MSESSGAPPPEPVLLSYECEGKLAVITLNNPTKLNPYTQTAYQLVTRFLGELAQDDRVVAAMITGSGSFYSSGTQLNLDGGFGGGGGSDDDNDGADLVKVIRKHVQINAGDFLDAFIDFPKPLIAAVNGPAVGVACTSLALCDLVYCAESSWFQTPFMKLGFCAEGCSSVLFPEIMGPARANEMLLLGKRLTAQEAAAAGLVAAVFPDAQFPTKVLQIAKQLASLPPQALRDTKALVRTAERRAELHRISSNELDMLAHRMAGEECQAAVMQHFQDQLAKKQKKQRSLM